jgi:outer membrane protein TolC
MLRRRTPAAATAALLLWTAPCVARAGDDHHPEHQTAREQAPNDDVFAGAQTLDRRALVAAVLDRNRTVDAARAAWRAAQAKPAQARALDDPMLAYSVAPASIGSDVAFGQVIDFSQRFPFPGKRGLRGAAAEAEARAMEDDFESTRRDVALTASTLFDDYFVATRSLEIKNELGRLLDGLARTQRASYVAGDVPQYGLIRIDVEKTHVEHDRIMLESEREVIESRINALLHRAPGAALPPPPARLEPLGSADATVDALEHEARGRSEVAAAGARVDAANATAASARREYLPDFGAGASYNSMWDDAEHRFMVGVSVNLPLQLGRRRAEVDEAEAEVIRRRSERDALVDRLSAEVEAAHHQFAAADHIVNLYDGRIVPAARSRVSSVRAAFETGQADFDSLIEAERELRDAQLAAVNALADRNRRFAELERTVGRVPGTGDSPAAPAGEPR